MGKKPKTRMDQTQRAKQFMPFAALKGFEEALEQKETATDRSAAAGRSLQERRWESGERR